MLNVLEKIQYGLSACVVLVVVVLYLRFPPTTQTAAGLPPSRPRTPPQAPRAGAPATPPSKTTTVPATPKAAPAIDPQDRDVLDRLSKRGLNVAGKALTKESNVVAPATVKFLSNEANPLEEAKKAMSEPLAGPDGRNTRFRLSEISEDSLLKTQFGIQNNDIVEFIDGEEIDYDGPVTDHMNRYQRVIQNVSAGKRVTITITRNGQPMQLEFGM